MRRIVTTCVLVLTLCASAARADVPTSAAPSVDDPNGFCANRGPDCLTRFPQVVIRLHAGLGVFLNGGAVSTTIVPNLFEHARLSAQLGGEVGIRPFRGGTMISVILAGQAATGAVVGTLGLSLEYDLAYIWDRNPNRDFALAIGGALAIDYAHTTTTSAAGITWPYDLLRPDWRAYAELRIRASARERWLVRAQIVTGFDDVLDIASFTLCGGYVFEAL